MANYFLHVKTFSRGNGSRVTKAAAYRAGERIRDQRTGEAYNYTARTDVAHAEIVLPTEYADRVDMEWALDRSRLWNAAEHSGRQWNCRLGREILVHVPPEMTAAQRVQLVRGFSRELADRYRNAVDFAVHEPRAQADRRHHHAHLLMTTREIGPNGLGARTTLDLSGTERHARGLGHSKDELLWMRERWAEVTNAALREAGLAARVDHRSYKAQGIDREPQPVIPRAILYSERASGRSSPAGDDIRARHRERVEARLKGGEELARVVERQRAEGRLSVFSAKAVPIAPPSNQWLTCDEPTRLWNIPPCPVWFAGPLNRGCGFGHLRR
jgi:ATP-dependent exoDNAse (exonuclease V) alpha subunit